MTEGREFPGDRELPVDREGDIYETLRKNSEKDKLEGICRPLLSWYDENRRVLPWRESPTPYRVWVSEVMLQLGPMLAVLTIA